MSSVNPTNNGSQNQYLTGVKPRQQTRLTLPTQQVQQAQDQFIKRVQSKIDGADQGNRLTYTVNSRFGQLKAKIASANTAAQTAAQNDALATKVKSNTAAQIESKQSQSQIQTQQTQSPVAPSATEPTFTEAAITAAAPAAEPEVQEGGERLFNFQDLEAARDLIGVKAEESNFIADYDLDGDGEISFNDLVEILFRYDSGDTPA